MKIHNFNHRFVTVLLRIRVFAGLMMGGAMLPGLVAAPHRYDHVVIVVEENRTPGQIIGDTVNAPYITSLANAGVRLGSIFALQHPSQPNYLHLFSGDTQGVIDDNLPPNFSTNATSTYPFRTPNLGAELISGGFTFAGYSEQLESAGAGDWADYDPHSATHPGIYYRRKHNPWANWVAKVSPIPANQLSPSLNKAFIDFPTNFAQLPTVSFVIPNQMHDMHDGSRQQGDTWLRDNLSTYAEWAKTNNSLLIVTWDEDDYNSVNQIPTVFYGAGLRNATTTTGTWTLHNLLRTIEDMYGLAHAGTAAQVRSIVGPFTNDPAVTVQTFRQGLAGYAGAQDTQIWQENPATAYGTLEDLTADLDTSTTITGNQVGQALIRFDSIFGSNAGQVPTNATIQSAKLIIFTPLSPTGADYDSDDVFRLHRMLVDWT
ncbi:MAG TPA: alkaline phosphatase family protein, partial [Candidatus Binatia bacterium]|nr:alkaline phosphatase family protein [Candidatus Binatia bacterium]